ncbi:DUF2795 domain-containing protein [Natronomonas sp. CBA1123]|uniref:DUF5789 family protein n=1 Tax=Natronomonas sp. CBA1123 TaxID=2668070 RepID=UPI0012EA437C|nr:DUF2795 domain-containing protein [Natronomonas sp. CBA1123]MUV87876.1 DUF2795 domain-containing protein [Natronomonas sp. CBA1123]
MELLANVDDRIDAHTYPATATELIEEYGELELEVPNGEETFGEALGRLGDTTFEDADDARLAAYSAVSKNAIGRENYSDRDAPSIGENGPEQVSF